MYKMIILNSYREIAGYTSPFFGIFDDALRKSRCLISDSGKG